MSEETKTIKLPEDVEFNEFELPFRYDENRDVVADGAITGSTGVAVPTGSRQRKIAIGKLVAEALNEHFARRWIKVSDALPEKSDYYWVTVEHLESGKRLVVEEYFYGGFATEVGFEILAWREKPKASLPEPFEDKL